MVHRVPLIAEALPHPQIRNRGTIGGNRRMPIRPSAMDEHISRHPNSLLETFVLFSAAFAARLRGGAGGGRA